MPAEPFFQRVSTVLLPAIAGFIWQPQMDFFTADGEIERLQLELQYLQIGGFTLH
jgi:hypothetical protein